MTAPTITVAVVTANRRQQLETCLESIAAQREPADEVIVVDNGSTDASREFVERRFPRFKLIVLDRNVGCPPARNIAVGRAHTDWVFFVDDDAVLEADAVEALRLAALADPGASVIAPRVIDVLPSGDEVGLVGPPQRVHRFGGLSAVRRQVMLDVGLYPEFVYGGEEQDLALRLLDRGHAIRFDPSIVLRHYPSATVRDRDFEMRCKLVNDVTVRWKYLPVHLALVATVRSVAVAGYLAVRLGIVRGFAGALWSLPHAVVHGLRERQPVGRETIRTYRSLARNYPLRVVSCPAGAEPGNGG